MGKGRQDFPTTPRATTGPSHTHLTHDQHTHHAPEPQKTWQGGLEGPREGSGWVWGAARPHETCHPAPYPAPRPPHKRRIITHLAHAQHTHYAPEPHQTWHGGLGCPKKGALWF